MNYDGVSKLSCGMYIVSAKAFGKDNAMLASLAMQVSSEPAMLCVSVNKANYTCDMIRESKKFNLSIFNEKASVDFMRNFGFKSGRTEDKLAGVKCEEINGIKTITEGCNGVVLCEVEQEVECGESVVFFAKIVESKTVGSGASMTLHYYQAVLNGYVSQTSPGWAARYTK